MSAKENKELMRRLIEEFNKGKAAAMAAMDKYMATNFASHDGDDMSLKDFKQMQSESYDAYPDTHYTINDMVAEGDKVATRVTMTGTNKGEYMGRPPTNKKVTVSGIIIERLAGGKIVEDWSVFDSLGEMRQLGLLPTPKKEK